MGYMCRTCRIFAWVHTWQCSLLPPSLSPVFGMSPHVIPPQLHTLHHRECVMLPSLCPCVLIVQHLPMSENMWCLIFCSCVSLLRMVVSRFIHVPTKDMSSFFFVVVFYGVCIPHFLYLLSMVGIWVVPSLCYCE